MVHIHYPARPPYCISIAAISRSHKDGVISADVLVTFPPPPGHLDELGTTTVSRKPCALARP